VNSNFQLDPQQWSTLRQLLDEALERPPSERAAWLDQLDETRHGLLKPRLRALLAHDETEGAARSLETLPKVETVEFAPRQPGEEGELPRERIGPYRLVRLLGEGGMGSVWLAERTDILQKRPVALKLPRGAWRRAGLAERMAREREILAALNHPNIARLYDAGVADDGQPYLALEYVEGKSIDAYCSDNHLDIRARLQLFLQVARAVAHAHANLVLHRDLKPSNILVTEAREVRLLDFGIAKLLAEGGAQATAVTEVAGRAMTPDYASPEQILGRALSTASDVYSLGVVLYQLLTGARPYKLKRESRGALEDAIVHAEPARPSEIAADPKLRRALRGDLGTIVLKALKKAPHERYGTVGALVDDIERYLDNRPVLAQSDRTLYRLYKFVVRNKLSVAAGSAVLVAVLVGAGVAIWQARVAVEERKRVEQVKEFIASIFRDTSAFARGGGTPPWAADLLRKASANLDDSPSVTPQVRVELRCILGEVLTSIGDLRVADEVLSKATDEAERSLGPDHARTLYARMLLTNVYRGQGRTAEMRRELDVLVPMLRGAGAAAQGSLVAALTSRAQMELDDARYEVAVAAAQEAQELAVALLGKRHPHAIAASLALAEAHVSANPGPLAVQVAEQAQALARDAYQDNPRDPAVIEAARLHALALGGAGETERAIEILRRAARVAAEVYGETSIAVGVLTQNLGMYERRTGNVKDALATSERALRIVGEQAPRNAHTYLATAREHGLALLAARRGKAAVPLLQQGAQTANRVFGPDHRAAFYARADLALGLAYAGRVSEARQQMRTAVAETQPRAESIGYRVFYVAGVLERLAGHYRSAAQLQAMAQRSFATMDPESLALEDRLALAETLIELGLNAADAGNHQEAVQALERARAQLSGVQRHSSPLLADLLIGLGRSHLSLGAPRKARAFLQQADEFWRDFDPESRSAGEAAFWLARSSAALGRHVEARTNYARAAKLLVRSPFPADATLLQLARKG
jgi:serine/threonine-protein kinase